MASSFNEDDIRQIATLIQALDRSSFDFLQLEVGGIKITLGKGDGPALDAKIAPLPAATAPSSAPTLSPAATAAPAPAPQPAAAASDGSVAIVAPIMGVFYSKPDPGSPPFVAVGSTVAAENTVALIEVMKVFNAVRAGIAGTLSEICVVDGQFVEYGQVLFRVQPAQDAKSARAGAKQAGS
jgi:acetyl-CoA carboxylase biotin carboxyl carrier protein